MRTIVRILAVVFAVLFPPLSWGAITVDNVDSLEGTTTSANKNVTVGGSVNLAMVFVCQRDTDASGFTAGTASVTVGGAAATSLTAIQNADGLTRMAPFYRLAPATGTVNVAVTPDTGADRWVAGVAVFTGVAQTSTFNTEGTNSSNATTNADIDALASAVGELGVLGGCVRTATSTPSPDATAPTSTEILDVAHTNATSVRVFIYTEDGASSTIDMRVDLSASERWSGWAASLRPTASAFRRRGAVMYP